MADEFRSRAISMESGYGGVRDFPAVRSTEQVSPKVSQHLEDALFYLAGRDGDRRDLGFGQTGFGTGAEIPFQGGQSFLIVEKQGQMLNESRPAAFLEAVDIVPPVRVQGILEQRGAEQITDFVGAHARAKLVHLGLGDDVALRNIDLVGTSG